MRIFGTNMRFVDAVIIANVLVFFLGLGIKGLTASMALYPLFILQEPWTIITSMFAHGSLNHLFMNMLALYFFGMYVERIISEKDLIRLYLIGGIAGGLFYVLCQYAAFFLGDLNALRIGVVGASGALFAVGGALAVLRPYLRVVIFPFPVPMHLWQAEIIIFLVLTLLPGIAWQGHLGGLLAGAALGYIYKKRGGRPPETVYFVTRHY